VQEKVRAMKKEYISCTREKNIPLVRSKQKVYPWQIHDIPFIAK
jgi:hypothetical protein